ncbi:hypothetical protein PInf_007509 [Phytophthora infestans]|nr:hypothetical protein PInf_007509 [Phytophthora infestans]
MAELYSGAAIEVYEVTVALPTEVGVVEDVTESLSIDEAETQPINATEISELLSSTQLKLDTTAEDKDTKFVGDKESDIDGEQDTCTQEED